MTKIAVPKARSKVVFKPGHFISLGSKRGPPVSGKASLAACLEVTATLSSIQCDDARAALPSSEQIVGEAIADDETLAESPLASP